MARFRKCVVDKGIHHTPRGPAVVDPARIKHWHETITRMIAAGHKPPLSWGHVSSALPHPAEHPFWQSRYNAGKVTGSSIDEQGRWWLEGDAPGVEIDAEGRFVTEAELPGGIKVKAAIEEVSIGAMDWPDGSGKVWPDAPVHLALTPLPVWSPAGGQPAFVAVPGDEADGGAARAVQFGTNTLLARLSTMDFPPKKDDAPDLKPEPKPENESPKPPEPKPEDGDISAIVNALRGIGVNLPYNVGDLKALLIALETIAATKPAGGPMAQPTAPQSAPAPVEPGAFLSTIADPLTRSLVARAVEQDRAKRLARIEALGKRGLPGHCAQQLRQQASQAFFSTLPDGSLAPHPADGTLDLLEASLPASADGFRATYLSAIAEQAPPEGGKAGETEVEKHKKTADSLARRAGLPARPQTAKGA